MQTDAGPQQCCESEEDPGEKVERTRAVEQTTDADICPYCLSSIRANDRTMTCPECGIVHHQDCWYANGGCTTYGCGVMSDRIGDSFPNVRRQGAFRTAEPRPQIDPELLNPKLALPCAILMVAPALALLGYLFGIYGVILALFMAAVLIYLGRVFSRPDSSDTRIYIAFVLLGIVVLVMVLLAVASSQGTGIGG